jgi:chorismate--pyruvate lyase
VKIRTQSLYTRTRWIKQPMHSGAYRTWLIDHGSLTQRLQAKSKHFNVRALRLNRTKPQIDEAKILKIPQQQSALLREVLLLDQEQPLVFAHSVLPDKSMRGAWLGLSRLGNKPLGAALFSDPQVTRTPLQYKKINRQHALYRQAIKHLETPPLTLWARRSVFQLNSAFNRHVIMVTEVFLPNILEPDLVSMDK